MGKHRRDLRTCWEQVRQLLRVGKDRETAARARACWFCSTARGLAGWRSKRNDAEKYWTASRWLAAHPAGTLLNSKCRATRCRGHNVTELWPLSFRNFSKFGDERRPPDVLHETILLKTVEKIFEPYMSSWCTHMVHLHAHARIFQFVAFLPFGRCSASCGLSERPAVITLLRLLLPLP